MTPAVSASVFKPPKVKVIPQVIFTARKDLLTIGNAQLVLSGPIERPPDDDRVDKPSFLEGSNSAFGCSLLKAWTALLYSFIESTKIWGLRIPFTCNFSPSSLTESAQIFSTTPSAYSSFRSHDAPSESQIWKAKPFGCCKIARPNLA